MNLPLAAQIATGGGQIETKVEIVLGAHVVALLHRNDTEIVQQRRLKVAIVHLVAQGQRLLHGLLGRRQIALVVADEAQAVEAHAQVLGAVD